MTQKNITIGVLPSVSGMPANEAYEVLFRWIEGEAIAAHKWYLEEKQEKSTASKVLRILGVVLATIGSIFPTLSLIFTGRIPSEIGYLFLGAAGGAFLVDRGFGYSSAWTRYMATASNLNVAIKKYQLQWGLFLIAAPPADSPEGRGRNAGRIIKGFATEILSLIESETSDWIAEFQESLESLRDSASGDREGVVR